MQITDRQLRFGFASGQQHTTYADYLDLWKSAEELGLEWGAVFDHFVPIMSDPEGPCLEGLTMLSAMAAQTSTIRCGILVVGNTYRNPAILANIATTIDHISGGRMELGLGAGWWELEHQQYGIPFHTTGRRIRAMGETAQILQSLWTQHRTTYEGRYYQITDALCEPKPVQNPRIPLWIGGSGEQLTLRVVAESADGWNTFLTSVEAYRHKLDVLAQHCKTFDRDPADIRKSLSITTLVRESQASVQAAVDTMAEQRGVPADQLTGIFGTPDQVVEQLLPYAALGVGDFIAQVRAPYDFETLELFATRVAPMLRERVGA